jgi:hypothetical protein
MNGAPIRWSRVTSVLAEFTVLGAFVASSGCDSSAPTTALDAQAILRYLPTPAGSLPGVTVTPRPTTRVSAKLIGYSWHITSVKDPVRGSYTAAVERRSLTRLWFDDPDEGKQRASIALLLRDGRPTDLILSVEHGRFVCAGHSHDNACTLRVSVDDAAARPVRFSASRHRPATPLHLLGGDDARWLLAAISKGKRLRIEQSFREEGNPDIEFALTGLDPAIAKLMKRSVGAMPTAVIANPVAQRARG